METKMEAQLSSELQEMYLENKEWLSNILFLEDEMRFFLELFLRLTSSPVNQERVQQVAFINASLTSLQERRNTLKGILEKRKAVLETMLKDNVQSITLAFIEEDTAIINEIKSLLATDKEVKQELFILIEELKPILRTPNYPIL
ncbi:MAG: hypothetical protein ACQUHE_08345 [Bacteroidia bacterium]